MVLSPILGCEGTGGQDGAQVGKGQPGSSRVPRIAFPSRHFLLGSGLLQGAAGSHVSGRTERVVRLDHSTAGFSIVGSFMILPLPITEHNQDVSLILAQITPKSQIISKSSTMQIKC